MVHSVDMKIDLVDEEKKPDTALFLSTPAHILGGFQAEVVDAPQPKLVRLAIETELLADVLRPFVQGVLRFRGRPVGLVAPSADAKSCFVRRDAE